MINENHLSFFEETRKPVEIITFDELLKKLKNLRDFLISPEEEKSNQLRDEDLPILSLLIYQQQI